MAWVSSLVAASASSRALAVSRKPHRARSSAAWVRGTAWGSIAPFSTRAKPSSTTTIVRSASRSDRGTRAMGAVGEWVMAGRNPSARVTAVAASRSMAAANASSDVALRPHAELVVPVHAPPHVQLAKDIARVGDEVLVDHGFLAAGNRCAHGPLEGLAAPAPRRGLAGGTLPGR